MPAAGNRNGTDFNDVGSNGNYWSSTPNDNDNAYNLNFNSSNVNPQNNNNRNNGYSVRLSQIPSRDWLLTELILSYYCARANKRNTHSQVRFERDLISNLLELYHDLLSFRYRVGRSMCFIIERPVKREVFAASFRDRIVHHLLYRYLSPVFEPRFIYDSYSCRVGKGTLFGIERLEHHIRSVSRNYTQPCWVLKLDLEGYFMHINRSCLYDIVVTGLRAKGKHLQEEYALMEYLLRQVIFNEPTKGCYRKGPLSDWDGLPPSKSLFMAPEGCGLPIGNLTSQLFSNIYLNVFDQFVKRELKCRHYGRYVDDFYVVGANPRELLALIPRMSSFLTDRLGLTLHPRKIFLRCCCTPAGSGGLRAGSGVDCVMLSKANVSPPHTSGIPFLGAVVRPGRRSLSPRSRKFMLERLASTLANEPDPFRIRSVLHSYRGHLSHFTSCPARGFFVFRHHHLEQFTFSTYAWKMFQA